MSTSKRFKDKTHLVVFLDSMAFVSYYRGEESDDYVFVAGGFVNADLEEDNSVDRHADHAQKK
jgi:hypothetical protein